MALDRQPHFPAKWPLCESQTCQGLRLARALRSTLCLRGRHNDQAGKGSARCGSAVSRYRKPLILLAGLGKPIGGLIFIVLLFVRFESRFCPRADQIRLHPSTSCSCARSQRDSSCRSPKHAVYPLASALKGLFVFVGTGELLIGSKQSVHRDGPMPVRFLYAR